MVNRRVVRRKTIEIIYRVNWQPCLPVWVAGRMNGCIVLIVMEVLYLLAHLAWLFCPLGNCTEIGSKGRRLGRQDVQGANEEETLDLKCLTIIVLLWMIE